MTVGSKGQAGSAVVDENFTFWDYVKAAFTHKYRLPLLGKMPVNQMALFAVGVLGMFNPGFWFLGAAAELGYLAFLSSSASFQKLQQGERLLAKQTGFEGKVQAAIAALSLESRARYGRLLRECGLILGIAPPTGAEGLGTLSDMRAGGLNQLLWLFVRLLTSREVISNNLSQVDRASVEAEVDRVRERLARAEKDSALARSLQATLDIQIKRMENHTKALSSLEVIDAELERIEQQVSLIREESAVSGGPEFLSDRLDAVTSTLGETSRWMDQNAEFLGSLGTDELDAAALPRLPQVQTAAPPPPPPPRARQKG
jgi:hypothetical protein